MVGHIQEVILVGAAIWGIVEAAKTAFPKFTGREMSTRFLPFVVLLIGAFAFIAWPLKIPVIERALLGVIAGSFSSQIHNIVRKTIQKEAS